MNTSIYTIKYIFYFRGEDSVQNAISKISLLLSNYNRDSSNTTNENIILNIFDPRKSGITFYKKQFNIYDKSDNFTKSLQAMEKELTKTFTEVRLKDLASILEVNKNKANLDDITLLKGIPRTVVSVNLYSTSPGEDLNILKGLNNLFVGEGDLPVKRVSLVKNTSKKPSVPKAVIKVAKKVSSKTPKIIVEVASPVPSISLVKNTKKVSSKTSKNIPKVSKLVVPPISPVKVLRKVVGVLPIQTINGVGESKLFESWTQILSRYTPEIGMRFPNLFLGALSKEPSNNMGTLILFMFYIAIYVLYCIIAVITFIKSVPLLLSNVQDIPFFNIFQNISFDSSIFDNMFNILKNINESVPDILPRHH